MDAYLVRLRFQGPIHVGHDEAGIGMEAVLPFLHSDTIFSAFCNAWASCSEGNTYLKEIKEKSVPAVFSSAFFYRGNYGGSGVKYTYYLPRPMLPLPGKFGPLSKTVKNAEFITLEQFINWAKGRITDFASAQLNGIGSTLNNYKDLYTMQLRPRHAQDRLTMASSIYHNGEVFFRSKPNEGGLYFICLTSNKEALAFGLKILQHWGFGGIRSAGYGKFSYDLEGPLGAESTFGELLFSEAEDANAHCLLSLYYPPKSEMGDVNYLAYKTIIRKGWFHSVESELSLKRKSCSMLSEGSVMRKKPTGIVLDLKPKDFTRHAVFRSGIALSVSLRINDFDTSIGEGVC